MTLFALSNPRMTPRHLQSNTAEVRLQNVETRAEPRTPGLVNRLRPAQSALNGQRSNWSGLVWSFADRASKSQNRLGQLHILDLQGGQLTANVLERRL